LSVNLQKGLSRRCSREIRSACKLLGPDELAPFGVSSGSRSFFLGIFANSVVCVVVSACGFGGHYN
jgi:hypothetical protein